MSPNMTSSAEEEKELHSTLSKELKESEEKILKLRKEVEDKDKDIEKLQLQLQQQSDYEIIKREVQ